MRAKDAERFLKNHVLSDFEGWAAEGSLMFKVPIGYFIAGAALDTAFNTENVFYVNLFVTPLYIPSERLRYTFSRRLELPGEVWELPKGDKSMVGKRLSEHLKSEGAGYLGQLASLEGIAVNGVRISNPKGMAPNSTSVLDSVAGAHILLGDVCGAARELEEAIAIAGADVAPPPWSLDNQARRRALLSALKNGGVSAKRMLTEWRNLTIRNLNLLKYEQQVD